MNKYLKGIRSRNIKNVNGLDMHILEAGYETLDKPLVLLLHGFPELAFSWRKIIGPLADKGFYVVAPDLRGYGKTLGGKNDYKDDISEYEMSNLGRSGIFFSFLYSTIISFIPILMN